MKFHILVLSSLVLVGCSADATQTCDYDGGAETSPPRNEDNTDGGLCCFITNNQDPSSMWAYGFYTCRLPGDPLDPNNPPWICNVTFDGQCGGDSGLDCLTCFDPTCVVGMRCLDVNGTGSVIPCQ